MFVHPHKHHPEKYFSTIQTQVSQSAFTQHGSFPLFHKCSSAGQVHRPQSHKQNKQMRRLGAGKGWATAGGKLGRDDVKEAGGG